MMPSSRPLHLAEARVGGRARGDADELVDEELRGDVLIGDGDGGRRATASAWCGEDRFRARGQQLGLNLLRYPGVSSHPADYRLSTSLVQHLCTLAPGQE